MTNFTSANAVSPRVLIDFFEKTLPFSELDRNVLNQLTLGGLVDFYPKGQIILQQYASQVDKLYLIQKGAVKIYRVNPDKSSALVDHRGEGSSFGAVALISGSKSTLTVEAVEDTFCFLIGKEPFLETLQHDPIFSQHFFRGISDGIVDKAYSELRRVKVGMRADEAFHLFSRRIKDVIKKPPEFIGGSESIRIAAKKMTDLEIGSLLVTNSSKDVVGIVTDKDLRTKVVAEGLNVTEPVEKVMSFPVLKVSAADLCFEALIEMMNRQVHYLGVEWNGKMVGVVTDRDIMVIPGNSPLDLLRQVGSQRSIEGLYELSERAPLVVTEPHRGRSKGKPHHTSHHSCKRSYSGTPTRLNAERDGAGSCAILLDGYRE